MKTGAGNGRKLHLYVLLGKFSTLKKLLNKKTFFRQTGFWLPFRFTEKAYSQGPTGCIWAILTLSLNGLFACGGVSLLATTIGDVSRKL